MNKLERIQQIELLLASHFWKNEAATFSMPNNATLEVSPRRPGAFGWKAKWPDGTEWLSSSESLFRSQKEAKDDLWHCLRERLVTMHEKTIEVKSTL
jgi:hypothetical protein